MATYTHFAKQPDVLKHLILCEVLRNEAPQVYVETNSACAIYFMTQTPEQQYGIYHFLEKADDDKSLKASIYYQLESTEMAKGNYLGSPALAMNVLGKQAKKVRILRFRKECVGECSHLCQTNRIKYIRRNTSYRLPERHNRVVAFTSRILFHSYRSLRNRQERRFRNNLPRCPDTGYSIRHEVLIMVWIHDRK